MYQIKDNEIIVSAANDFRAEVASTFSNDIETIGFSALELSEFLSTAQSVYIMHLYENKPNPRIESLNAMFIFDKIKKVLLESEKLCNRL